MKPPVGPQILPIPPVKPVNTGNPTAPNSTYTTSVINACFGGNNNPIKHKAMVIIEIIPTPIGFGIDN